MNQTGTEETAGLLLEKDGLLQMGRKKTRPSPAFDLSFHTPPMSSLA